jgi:hypothetical protein
VHGSTGNVLQWTVDQSVNMSAPYYSTLPNGTLVANGTWAQHVVDTYVILQNNTEVANGTWSDGANITLDIDGLAIGMYSYLLNASDGCNNSVYGEYIVQVTAPIDYTGLYGVLAIMIVVILIIMAIFTSISRKHGGHKKH